ncbi:MAG: hypothetical protein LC794_12855 [Acidobacteria bacterium]|nr:hypothetical protein [Acidobacteriota bacterium]MCA1627560.1 hypothetical protein [Acidobacteriota bacterium]
MFINLIISVVLLFALPAEAGKFRQVKSDGDRAEYVSANGKRFAVELSQLSSDSKAYEMLSLAAAEARAKDPKVEIANAPGTAGFTTADQCAFFRGVHFVKITSLKPATNTTNLTALAKSLSDTLDAGEGDIPVLIKHLPEPEHAQKNAVYLNSITTLTSLAPQQGVLTAVQGDGNADAALATLASGKVLIVEFNTPQLATDNDKRITARIQELWKQGQPAPTAYRRVGNYSVFVFDAPDEQTAKQLIDQVKYEQVVSWLGENPNILRDAEQRYVNTMLGVLVAVVKASGYALVGCLGIGGLIGALLFTYRRSQQKAVTTYSDAGGMLRLNLDELTGDVSHRRR